MNSSISFKRELAGFPRPVAVELEDHLAEEADRLLRSGIQEDEARRKALANFGNLQEIGDEMRRAQASVTWCHQRTPWSLKSLAVVWAGIGLFCLLRVVYHHTLCCTPALDVMSSWSFAMCLFLGMGSTVLSLLLLRRVEGVRSFAQVFFGLVAFGFLLQSALVGLMPFLLPIDPGLLLVFAVGAGLSSWLMTRPQIRQVFA